MAKPGRPALKDLHPGLYTQAKELVSQGASISAVSAALELSLSTLYRWRQTWGALTPKEDTHDRIPEDPEIPRL